MDLILAITSKFDLFCQTVKPNAEKSGLEVGAVLLLLCLCENCDITEILKEKFLMQLFTTGFAELKDGKITVTGKGAIFGKSIAIALKRVGI